MKPKLQVGLSHHKEMPVTEADVASAYGNPGVHVFATPAMVTLIENTTGECLDATLPDGQGSVGTHLDVRHLTATPIGMQVRCSAEIIEIDRRRVLFAIEVHDETEKIGAGTHERFIVPDLPKFLAKASQKNKQEN